MTGKKLANVPELITALKNRKVRSTDIGARMWEGLLIASGIEPSTWVNKANNFFRREADREGGSKRKADTERGNAEDALSSNKISLYKLLQGINILNPLTVEITIKLTFRKKIVQHSLKVNRDNYIEDEQTDCGEIDPSRMVEFENDMAEIFEKFKK